MSGYQNQYDQTRNADDETPENKIDKTTKKFFEFHRNNFMVNIFTLQVMFNKKNRQCRL